MKMSYKWLQETLGLGLSPQELADELAAAGSQVESIDSLAPEIRGVVVAELLAVQPHPNADRLSLTKVSDGEAVYDVVCGAHNIAPGDRVPLARVGAVLPGNFQIKKSKIRGEVSQGMLCSAEELQLGLVQASAGILQLPKDAPLGRDINEYLGLDDCILDIELTADRGDLLSLRGLAIEIGALLAQPFTLKEPVPAPGGQGRFPVTLETDACTFYAGRIIEGVKVGPSPLWLQLRLLACGMRPRNNIVDIANLVMLEWGQPLHTFDADKLPRQEITVRLARPGEKIVTLDGKERCLEPEMMLITSGERPVALAGVMGSLDSEVDEGTTDLFLESALFNPVSVRRTAKALGLASEAATRFEKGVDPRGAALALQRAADLVAELAGGTPAALVQVGSDISRFRVIPVSMERVNGLLGTRLSLAEGADILARLGLAVESGDNELLVGVDDRRRDLQVWQDIAEEVGRLYGFAKVPATLPKGALTLGARKYSQSLEWQARELLAGSGLHEVVTYSFISPEMAEDSWSPPGVEIANPLTREASVMRGAILPSLLAAVAYNLSHGQDSAAIFEIGNIYSPGRPLPAQSLRAAGALAGREPRHWQNPGREYDFYFLKGVVQQFLEGLGVEAEFREKAGPQFHPGRSGQVNQGDTHLGYLGQVHPAITAKWKLDDVWFFDLDFTALVRGARPEGRFVPPSRFPAVRRDLAVECGQGLPAGTLMALIQEVGGELLEDIECFDVYSGGSLAPGDKSLAFALTFRHGQRTLAEKDVQKKVEEIIGCLAAAGARLRS